MATEKRLIYAEDLQQAIRDDLEIRGVQYALAFKHIREAKTVDAVEVVRCKDCVHKSCDNEWTDKDGKLHHFVQCVRHRFPLWHKPDDFCSYGERRSDG